VIGPQLNMVSQSWDGKRLYFTSSLLANWDGTGHEDAQFLKAFAWDGKQLSPAFEIDFRAQKLGRPHIMNLGSAGAATATRRPSEGAPGLAAGD